ncbi:MAG: hypothetical protein KKD86_00765 [Bacteroidetes bacterium]|nr:hypothetical protein [Bacteroidota bacterium]
MKKVLVLLAAASLVFFSCAENSSVVGPEQVSNSEVVKLLSNSTGKYQNSVQSVYTVSEEIDGVVGGEIKFSFSGGDITGILKVPAGAYSSVEYITISIPNQEAVAVVDFGPSPFSFYKALDFDITYKNAELNPGDENKLKFVYIDGENQVAVEYHKIISNTTSGLLGIKRAQLEHFSRYGFVR